MVQSRPNSADDVEGVGQRIKAAREAKGLTQSALADAADVRQGQISKIENGDGSATIETVMRLAAALEVSVDFLVGHSAPASQSDAHRDLDAVAALMTDDQVRLLAVIGRAILKDQPKTPAASRSRKRR